MILKQFRVIAINIIMRERVKSANRSLFPQPQSKITLKREELQNYSRKLFSKQTSRSTNYKNQSSPFTASSRRHHLFTRENPQNLINNTPFSFTGLTDLTQVRPFTEAGKNCHRRNYSPLEIIRTRSKCQSKDQRIQTGVNNKSTPSIKCNFLRKGSSVDKAVITNVLRSKLNFNTSASSFCYSDSPFNKQLAAIVSKQIPKGIRDIVGVQQMMRMSHILTGAEFKSVNLTHRLNMKLKEVLHKDNHHHVLDQDDNITLKSIKRW